MGKVTESWFDLCVDSEDLENQILAWMHTPVRDASVSNTDSNPPQNGYCSTKQ